MALLWADGFDHWGTDEAKMLDGAYARSDGGTLGTSIVATGTHSYHCNTRSGEALTSALRKVLPATSTKIGVAFRLYMPSLPSVNDIHCIGFQGAAADTGQVAACIDSNGAFRFRRGIIAKSGIPGDDGTEISASSPLVTAAAWQHVEIQIYTHNSAGWVRIAINGVHRYEATGLDTLHDGTGIASVMFYSPLQTGGGAYSMYIDDLYIYDFVGSSAVETDFVPTTDGSGVATNYIGELQCIYLPPNGDTAEDDWVASTGTDSSAMVDETTPNDADYITSSAGGDLSEFTLTDLDPEITYIRGLMLLGRLSKSDSGVAETRFGMKSVAATTDATARAITTAPTYWWDFINVDPDSSARWTRASLNAAWIRLTRST